MYNPPVPKNIFSREQQELQSLLRAMRTQAGLTQADLAKRLSQSQSFVSKYESGERRLDCIELRQVCLALGVDFPDFIRRFEESVR